MKQEPSQNYHQVGFKDQKENWKEIPAKEPSPQKDTSVPVDTIQPESEENNVVLKENKANSEEAKGFPLTKVEPGLILFYIKIVALLFVLISVASLLYSLELQSINFRKETVKHFLKSAQMVDQEAYNHEIMDSALERLSQMIRHESSDNETIELIDRFVETLVYSDQFLRKFSSQVTERAQVCQEVINNLEGKHQGILKKITDIGNTGVSKVKKVAKSLFDKLRS
uniref:Uncharacterized protein n=1 Tax=Euplotes crassus TaxID=5936 RepID=A0A7S3KKU0_EUPCR|mmetsp:Transcript_29371/g.28968  ORF Transcript_29371/g.28968 Transcript_29371/m.28968 type:complete len:226 (+) Transcript_29371:2-679(+)